jgi:GntR family transcriptional regulator
MANRPNQIAHDLRQQIRNGTLPAGTQLPAETALATHYRVGRPTLRHALAVLQGEGLLEKRHGLGNFVRDPGHRIAYTNNHNQPPAPDLTVSVTTREHPADEHLAALMDVPPGTLLAEYVYLARQGNQTPHSVVRAYLPHDLAPAKPSEHPSPWADDLHHQLRAAGIPLNHTTERITARPPTEAEAELLQVPTSATVLAIQRTTHATTGRTVEAAYLTLSSAQTEAIYTTRANQSCSTHHPATTANCPGSPAVPQHH